MKEETLAKTEIRVRMVRLDCQDRLVWVLERVNVESLVFLERAEARVNLEIEDRLDSPVFPVFPELWDYLEAKARRETLDSQDQEAPQAPLDHKAKEVEPVVPEKMVRRVALDREVTPATAERGAPAVAPDCLDLRDCQVHLGQPVHQDQSDQKEERVAVENLDSLESLEAMEHLASLEETARKEKVEPMDHLDHQAQSVLLGLKVSADNQVFQDSEEKTDQKDHLASAVKPGPLDQLVIEERGVERDRRDHPDSTEHLERLDRRVLLAKTVFLACKEGMEKEDPEVPLDHQALLVLKDFWAWLVCPDLQDRLENVDQEERRDQMEPWALPDRLDLRADLVVQA